MTRKTFKKHRIMRLTAIVAFAAFALAGFLHPHFGETTHGIGAEPTPPRRKPRKATPTPTPTPPPEDARFAVFKHQIHLDMEMECSACHKFPTANWDKVRSKETAFPDVTDFPKHESCLDCHREQFFAGKPPAICSSCHVNPSPNDGTRHPFPNPREAFDLTARGKSAESQFKVAFPHDKHIEIVSRNGSGGGALFVNAGFRRMSEDSCKVCHQTYRPQGDSDAEFVSPAPKDLGDAFWLKKGTFKSSPIGHANCFTCHSADSGITPAPTDCGTCHRVREPLPATDFSKTLAARIPDADKIMLDAWKRRASSATFRHEFFSHADLSCSTCHNVSALNTADIRTKKVPVASCAPCHITATVDDGGVLNAEIESRNKDPKFTCVKCHLSYGGAPVPASHLKAIADQK